MLALLAHDGDTVDRHDEAELSLIEAELSCLYNRQSVAADSAVALDVAHQIRDALAARQTLQ